MSGSPLFGLPGNKRGAPSWPGGQPIGQPRPGLGASGSRTGDLSLSGPDLGRGTGGIPARSIIIRGVQEDPPRGIECLGNVVRADRNRDDDADVGDL